MQVLRYFMEVAAPPACSTSPSTVITCWSMTTYFTRSYPINISIGIQLSGFSGCVGFEMAAHKTPRFWWLSCFKHTPFSEFHLQIWQNNHHFLTSTAWWHPAEKTPAEPHEQQHRWETQILWLSARIRLLSGNQIWTGTGTAVNQSPCRWGKKYLSTHFQHR